jgi:hypothetical protein
MNYKKTIFYILSVVIICMLGIMLFNDFKLSFKMLSYLALIFLYGFCAIMCEINLSEA